MTDFDRLLAEGAAVPVEGWDFSWFEGRATEERPPWGYQRLLAARLRTAGSALDVQTGGGEVLRGALDALARPALIAATESWPPNVALARAALEPFGGRVEQVADDAPLPFPGGMFELVSGRHPVTVDWAETARVMRPGGAYLGQHVGVGTVHELTEAMLGPTPVSQARHPDRAVAAALAAGLDVTGLRTATLRLEFFDVAAVAVFLRKVIWIVPGFTVEAFRAPLRAVHERILADGAFVAHTSRYLIECSKPHRNDSG